MTFCSLRVDAAPVHVHMLTRVVYVACGCTGEQTGRHLLLAALRADGRQAHHRHSRGQESQKDGRGRIIRYMCNAHSNTCVHKRV